jgi:hypothetical protein
VGPVQTKIENAHSLSHSTPIKKVKAEVGVDVGIKILARTSDGQRLENPRLSDWFEWMHIDPETLEQYGHEAGYYREHLGRDGKRYLVSIKKSRPVTNFAYPAAERSDRACPQRREVSTALVLESPDVNSAQ